MNEIFQRLTNIQKLYINEKMFIWACNCVAHSHAMERVERNNAHENDVEHEGIKYEDSEDEKYYAFIEDEEHKRLHHTEHKKHSIEDNKSEEFSNTTIHINKHLYMLIKNETEFCPHLAPDLLRYCRMVLSFK